MVATKIYKAGDLTLCGNIISAEEAKAFDCDVTGYELASIGDLIECFKKDGIAGVFGGPVLVTEGVYMFDYSTEQYYLYA